MLMHNKKFSHSIKNKMERTENRIHPLHSYLPQPNNILPQRQNAISSFFVFIIPIPIAMNFKTIIAEKQPIAVTIPSSFSAKLAIVLHVAVITIRHPTLVAKELPFPRIYLKILQDSFQTNHQPGIIGNVSKAISRGW